ncbi:hypothetical protein HK405_000807, partial [Cladochytrium tenue]
TDSLADWPTFFQTFSANIDNRTDPPASWAAHYSQLTCQEWANFPTHILSPTVRVPVLEAAGPAVESVFDLLAFALKLAAANPSSQSPLTDPGVRAVAGLCNSCRATNLTYAAVYAAIVASGDSETPCLKGSLLGGRAPSVASGLNAISKAGPAPRAVAVATPAMDGSLRPIQLIAPDDSTFLYYERCQSASLLSFNLTLEGVVVSVPQTRLSSKKAANRMELPLSVFAAGRKLTVHGATIGSKAVGVPASALVSKDGASLLITGLPLTIGGGELYG